MANDTGDLQERNVYAAPAAEIHVPGDIDDAEFYLVGRRKFLLLYLFTLGVYQIYWFYRHWKHYRRYHHGSLWPIPRAIFAIFFTHALAGHIDRALTRTGARHRWSPMAVATYFVLFAIVSNILDRLSWREVGSPYTDWASLLMLLPLAAAMLAIQGAANAACGDPAGQRNARLTAANWIWLILGGAFWALALLGILLPAE